MYSRQLKSLLKITNPTGWRQGIAKLIHLRENLLNRIIRYVGGEGNQKTLAAMTLEFRQSLNWEEREIYIKSGMLHILAISGLHFDISFF